MKFAKFNVEIELNYKLKFLSDDDIHLHKIFTEILKKKGKEIVK